MPLLLIHFPLFPLQGIESENMNVVKRLFKLQNLNASTIRTVMVVDCNRYDSPDLVPNQAEQLVSSPATATSQATDLCSESEEEEEEPKHHAVPDPSSEDSPEAKSKAASGDGLDRFLTDIIEGRVRPVMTELEMETKVAQLLAKKRTKPPEPNLLSMESCSQKKYLIFTTGCLTYSPHQIGKGPLQGTAWRAF